MLVEILGMKYQFDTSYFSRIKLIMFLVKHNQEEIDFWSNLGMSFNFFSFTSFFFKSSSYFSGSKKKS